MTAPGIPLRPPYRLEATEKPGRMHIVSTGSWAEDPYLIAEASSSTPARLATLRLMAAAPELLAALNLAIAAFRELDDDWRGMSATLVDQIIANTRHKLAKAAAKAEGRTT